MIPTQGYGAGLLETRWEPQAPLILNTTIAASTTATLLDLSDTRVKLLGLQLALGTNDLRTLFDLQQASGAFVTHEKIAHAANAAPGVFAYTYFGTGTTTPELAPRHSALFGGNRWMFGAAGTTEGIYLRNPIVLDYGFRLRLQNADGSLRNYAGVVLYAIATA